MPIQFKFFVISVKICEEAEADLNRFIRSKRVLAVHRYFVQQRGELILVTRHMEPLIEFTRMADAKGFRKNVIERFGVSS